jgi:hypothetical protein
MASQLLGVSQGAATTAALEKVTGNYSFGNVSLDGVQSDHTNLFKHDMSAAYSGGHFSVQDGASSRLIAANGEQIVNRSLSQLPVTIHGSEAQEQVYRTLASEAESISVSESEQAMQSQQAMASDYLQIGKHASHMIQSGEQFSHQETASSLHEAARAYNQAKRIAQEFGISEDLVNQKVAGASVGLNISVDPVSLGPVSFGFGVGGEVSKQETAASRANRAENAIRDLAQSEDFRNSIQHGYYSFQNKNFDVNDQAIRESVHNYSANYEQAQSHQRNATKAYETSQALQKEMGVNQSKSLAVDSNYSQDFVNHVGAERLEHMSTEEMQKQAQAFVAHKTKALEGNLRFHHDLKEAYGTTTISTHFERPEILRDQNFTRIHNQSAQEGLSFERPISDDVSIQARQMLDINHYQTMRTGKNFENKHAYRQDDFKEAIKKHAHDEMGLIQASATQALYDKFHNEEVKGPKHQEQAAVNSELRRDKDAQ